MQAQARYEAAEFEYLEAKDELADAVCARCPHHNVISMGVSDSRLIAVAGAAEAAACAAAAADYGGLGGVGGAAGGELRAVAPDGRPSSGGGRVVRPGWRGGSPPPRWHRLLHRLRGRGAGG